MKIRRINIFTKSILFAASCCGVAIILLLITMKYINTAGLDITAMASGNVADKIAYLCFQVVSSVFGFASVSNAIVGLFFSYFFFVMIVAACVILVAFLIFWLTKNIMKIGG